MKLQEVNTKNKMGVLEQQRFLCMLLCKAVYCYYFFLISHSAALSRLSCRWCQGTKVNVG